MKYDVTQYAFNVCNGTVSAVLVDPDTTTHSTENVLLSTHRFSKLGAAIYEANEKGLPLTIEIGP